MAVRIQQEGVARTRAEDPDASQLYPQQLGEPETNATDEDKATYVTSRWYDQRDYYSGLYRSWAKAILFLLGKQYLTWSRQQKAWVTERDIPKWRQQPVTNLCFSAYRAAMAKLKKQRPAFICIAASGDTDDRNAASLGNALLKYWWSFFKMPQRLSRLLAWLLSTGNGYVMVSWDPEAGEIRDIRTSATDPETGDEIDDVPADKDGKPIYDDGGKPDLEAKPHRMAIGDISITMVSPFSVRWNAEAESPEDATEWYIGDIMSTATAAKEFGIDQNLLGGSADDELMTTLDMITAATTGTTGGLNLIMGSDNTTAKGKRSLVIRYYRRPCTDYPDGRHWVTVDGKMWKKREIPLPYGFWPPVVPCQDVPVPGQAQSMGLLGQIAPINERYNSDNAIVKEHNVTMARGGKWLLSPEDALMPINSDPGQKLVSKGYAANHPPVQLQPKPLPDAVINERQHTLEDFFLVSAMSEASLGQRPEGVTSGRAFLALQEATDSVLGPTLESVEECLGETGRRCLVLAHKYYRESRTVKIAGENGAWQIRSFQGSDLTDSLDVQVQVGSSFPWSKAARQDTAISMLEKFPQLVTNPDGTVNMQKFSRYVNIGGIEAFEAENDPDLDEIALEHARFEDPNDGIPEIGFWQDHPAHYAGHCDFLKRDRVRFERWPQDRQQAFLQHILETQAAIGEAVGGLLPPEPPMQPVGPDGQPQPTPSDASSLQGNATVEQAPSDMGITPADQNAATI